MNKSVAYQLRGDSFDSWLIETCHACQPLKLKQISDKAISGLWCWAKKTLWDLFNRSNTKKYPWKYSGKVRNRVFCISTKATQDAVILYYAFSMIKIFNFKFLNTFGNKFKVFLMEKLNKI